MIRRSLCRILVFLVALGAQAQAPVSRSPEWKYKPADQEFWQKIEKLLQGKDHLEMIRLGEAQIKASDNDSLQAAEGTLAEAIGLSRMGMSYGATVLLSDLVTGKAGTAISERALLEIEEIVKTSPVDEDDLFGRVLWDRDLPPAGPTRDFVNFQNGIFNKLKGFEGWSEEDFKKVSVGSYWDFRLKYLSGLEEVKKNQIDSAIERFASLSNNLQVPSDLKTEATHQYARLIFEKGEYAQAYKIFKTVDLSPRERGQVILERAWSKYYTKDYSKALGLLTALNAPIFETSRTPEASILKMLILKDLCYYDAVFAAQDEFLSQYSGSLKLIRRRGDLTKDPILVNMALLDRQVAPAVFFLNQIKEERSQLKPKGLEKFGFITKLRRAYDLKIRELYGRLDWNLQKKTREVADQLLDWQEQVMFLDYQARVDSLRVSRPVDEIDLKPEEIPHMSFNKIYWIFAGEYWLDELENLKAQVESKCQAKAVGGSR